MKARIELYLRDGMSKAGYPVKIIVSHKGKRKRKTIAYSFEKDWNIQRQEPLSTHKNFTELYAKIYNIRSLAYSLVFRDFVNLDLAMDFLLHDNKQKRIDFYEFAESRIQFMKNQNREGNAIVYKFSIDALKRFKKELFFDEITSSFLEQFKMFKLSEQKKLKNGSIKTVSNSAISTYLRTIRAIYNSCVRLNDVTDTYPFKGLFLDLKVKKKRKKNIYILKDSFKILEAVTLKSRAKQRVVDLTLLQFYFCGLDLVDLYYLKWNQIQDDRIFLKRIKLGAKGEFFDIKLVGKAKKIIEKYTINTNEYVFPWRKDRKGYTTFRTRHNKMLKVIVSELNLKILPVPGPFTTKSVRHSFATIAKFLMIDVDIIRELMGHERNDIDTIYKDLYPVKIRDEAQLKIISI